jgi:hypothetical protein
MGDLLNSLTSTPARKGSLLDSLMAGSMATPTVTKAGAKQPDPLFSGNAFMDVIEAISIPGWAGAGMAQEANRQEAAKGGPWRGYDLGKLAKAAVEGAKNRTSWRDVLREHPTLFGYDLSGKSLKIGKWDVPATEAVGLALDIRVDPADMVIGPALGLLGKGVSKGAKAIGLTDAVRAIPAPQKLLDAVANGRATKPGLAHVTLKGKTLGEVVDTLASDTQALRKVFEAEDAAVREAAKVLEPVQGTVDSVGKWSKPIKELMGDYIEAPNEQLAAEVLERVRGQLKAEKVKDVAKAEAQFLQDAAKVPVADAHLLKSKQAAGLLTNTAENAQHLRRTYLMHEDPQKWGKELLSLSDEEFAQRMKLLRNFGIEPVLENGTVAGFKATGSGKRISTEELGSLLQRHAIPPDVRAAMGEIKDAEYRLVKSAKADANLVAKKKFQEQLAEMFAKDFYPPGFAPGPGASKLVEDAAWQKARRSGYAMIPDDKDAWGALAGRWVPEVVVKYLQDPRVAKTGALQQMIGLWKAGKTILNPATHVRNSLTNELLTDWGTGLTPLSPRWWSYKGQALKALTQHNSDFEQAKAAGSFLTDTFRSQELSKILDNGPLSEGKLKAVYGWLQKAGKKPGDLYEFEEQLGKMTVYLSERDKLVKAGADVFDAAKQAAAAADKWLINYRRVPKWVDLIRNGQGPLGVLGTVPFITFQYKVAPLVAEAMVKHPTRVTKYFKIGRGVEALADPDETAAEKRVMPEWMKEGIWVKLPMKDKYDRSLYLDATYLIPLADLSGAKVIGPGGEPAMMSTPFVNLLQDVMRNQSRFTGRPIWGQGMTKEDVAKNIGEYIGSQLLPSLAPGGYGYRNIRDAVAKKPDWLGRTRTLDQVLAAQLLGFKTRPIMYSEEAMFRQKEFEDEINAIKIQLRKRMVDPAISEENKQRAWDKSMEMVNEILAQMDATFR